MQFILHRHPTILWSLIDHGITQVGEIFDLLFVPIM